MAKAHAVIVLSTLALSLGARLQPHRQAFLATKWSEKQNTDASSTEKYVLYLDSEARQFDSDIVEVQQRLDMALLQIMHLAANNTNHTKAPCAICGSHDHATHEHHHAHNATHTNDTQAPCAICGSTDHATHEHHLAKHEDSKKVMTNATSLIHANKTMDTKSAILHEKSVLEDLFAHLKSNIGRFNKAESEDKTRTEKMKARLEARLKTAKAKLAMKNCSAFEHELLTNQTRQDEAELKYFSRDRDLGHQMFHGNLKMTHSLMSRVKMVLGIYNEAAEKGHVDPELLKKAQAMTLPKTFFLQMREEMKQNAQKYEVHLRQTEQLA